VAAKRSAMLAAAIVAALGLDDGRHAARVPAEIERAKGVTGRRTGRSRTSEAALKRILVPLDGSRLAGRALPYAAALAERTGARLLLLLATPSSPSVAEGVAGVGAAAIGEAEAELEAVARRLRTRGTAVGTRVRRGPAAPTILAEVRSGRADLVVMATHGQRGLGPWSCGGVADAILRGAEVPVLVVPAGASSGWSADGEPSVVVPLDGSRLAEEALGPAGALANALGARLVLLRVVEPLDADYLDDDPCQPCPETDDAALAAARGYLDHVAARLRERGRAVDARAEAGPPAATIAAVAHRLGAGVRSGGTAAVALTTHGRGGCARAAVGSVAAGLLHRADTPILLVRPTGLAQAAPTHSGEPR
jgi:nucleotide-binding universal stress UspA family protein